MIAACQVMHSTSGRLRLQVPSMHAHPEIAQILIALLFQQAGVTDVKALSSNSSHRDPV